MTDACATCRFAAAFTPPGPMPQIPPAPNPHWLWGGEDSFERFGRELPLIKWKDRDNAYRSLIRCRRYPGKQPTMRKTDVCGEFQP